MCMCMCVLFYFFILFSSFFSSLEWVGLNDIDFALNAGHLRELQPRGAEQGGILSPGPLLGTQQRHHVCCCFFF